MPHNNTFIQIEDGFIPEVYILCVCDDITRIPQ